MARFDEPILAWYDEHRRLLPWRETNDPYRILVSEVMLQQTQVDRVVPFFLRWIESFPNWKTLAEAPTEHVLRLWSGLGYNRRALTLQRIAAHVVVHGVPKTRAEWLTLKGIGPYTSAALSVFALNERHLAIDTNVRRLLGRYLLADPSPTQALDQEIENASQKIVQTCTRLPELTQALFDIASKVCKKQPDCANCPLNRICPLKDGFLSGQLTVQRLTKPSNERIQSGKRFPDRIYRGRILKLTQTRPLTRNEIGPLVDSTFQDADQGWIDAMIYRLIKDGLLVERTGLIGLP